MIEDFSLKKNKINWAIFILTSVTPCERSQLMLSIREAQYICSVSLDIDVNGQTTGMAKKQVAAIKSKNDTLAMSVDFRLVIFFASPTFPSLEVADLPETICICKSS